MVLANAGSILVKYSDTMLKDLKADCSFVNAELKVPPGLAAVWLH